MGGNKVDLHMGKFYISNTETDSPAGSIGETQHAKQWFVDVLDKIVTASYHVLLSTQSDISTSISCTSNKEKTRNIAC